MSPNWEVAVRAMRINDVCIYGTMGVTWIFGIAMAVHAYDGEVGASIVFLAMALFLNSLVELWSRQSIIDVSVDKPNP